MYVRKVQTYFGRKRSYFFTPTNIKECQYSWVLGNFFWMKKTCLVVILALIGRCTLAIREVDEIAQAKAAKGDLTGEIVTFVFGLREGFVI